ncbi:Putative UDP-rhamnose:rhamnosyltransferase 1 [Linum perenne]
MADDESKKQLHIAVLPWLAFGHMMPFLELSKLIAEKGHSISFISTPRNIERLHPIPPHLSHLINFVPIPLPAGDGYLPDGAESTSNLPSHLVPHLKLAFDALEPEVAKFFESRKPDWIIYDFAPYWIPRIAAKSNVSTAYLTIISAASWCFFGPPDASRNSPEDFTYTPKWIPFPNNLAFHLHEARRLMAPPVESDPPPPLQLVPDYARIDSCVAGCQVFAVRSCPELESDMLDLATQLFGKRVIPVGLLIPAELDPRFVGDETWNRISEWLNKRKKATVVYVAFGSETAITKDEVTELSLGLEASGSPFVWVLNQKYHHLLPEGYRSRIEGSGSGLICSAWVPQLRILGHESVGGFLTHCGAASVIESLHFGVPLIMLTLNVPDQGINARVCEKKEVGIEIPRKEEDGAFVRGDVAETVRKVMAAEEGQRLRVRAAEEREKVFGNREIHDRCVSEFVKVLEEQRRSGGVRLSE